MATTSSAIHCITRSEALAAAEACARLLRERYGARRVIPFGSVRGDAPWHADSDLDLAVEGLPPEQFFDAWGALRALLPPGLEVDLVSLEETYPEMRARILGEVDMPNDEMLKLKGIVEDELKTLGRVAQRMEEILQAREEPPTWRDLAVIASLLHEFYTGAESIFERIVDTLGEPKPQSRYWHADLLDQMAEEREGVRPAVIDGRLHTRLEDYRRFRHFFRHAYGHDLLWSKMSLKAVLMTDTLGMLRSQLTAFLDAMTGASDDPSLTP